MVQQLFKTLTFVAAFKNVKVFRASFCPHFPKTNNAETSRSWRFSLVDSISLVQKDAKRRFLCKRGFGTATKTWTVNAGSWFAIIYIVELTLKSLFALQNSLGKLSTHLLELLQSFIPEILFRTKTFSSKCLLELQKRESATKTFKVLYILPDPSQYNSMLKQIVSQSNESMKYFCWLENRPACIMKDAIIKSESKFLKALIFSRQLSKRQQQQ